MKEQYSEEEFVPGFDMDEDISGIHEDIEKQISISFKNVYFSRIFQHAESSHLKNPDWHQWAQAIIADFRSGYFLNTIGLDAEFDYAIKLDGKNPAASGGNQLLHFRKNHMSFASHYERVGRLNLKMKLGSFENDDENAILRLGYIGTNSGLTSDCDVRLFSSSYRGASLLAHLPRTNIYGYYLDRIGFPAGNTYEVFTNGQGKKVSAVYVAGAEYSIPHYTENSRMFVNMEVGQSSQYLRGLFSQFSYEFSADKKTSLLANLQYRYSEKAGRLWSSGFPPPGKKAWCWRCLPASESVSLSSRTGSWFDSHASLVNINLKGYLQNLEAAISYSHTQAKSSGTGANSNKFHYSLVGNNCGSGTFWTSRQVSSFNYHNENTWQIMTAYHFSGLLNGFSTNLTHTYGSGIDSKTGLKNEEETDISIAYKIPSGMLKDLSFAVDNAVYVSRHRQNNSYGTRGYRLNDLRMYMMYKIGVF